MQMEKQLLFHQIDDIHDKKDRVSQADKCDRCRDQMATKKDADSKLHMTQNLR